MDNHTTDIRRRSRTGSRLKQRLAAVAVLGVASCATLLVLLACQPEPDHPARPEVADTAPAAQAVASAPVAPVATATARRIYKYSVIPGGVYGRDELLRVLKTDQVVAAHYASFNANVASEVTVTKPRAVYVSYRKGDKIYWTSKKVMLVEGETLLSDGQSEIRARCGNRISDVPQFPVELKGPTVEELDSSVEVAQDSTERPELYAVQFSMDDNSDMSPGHPYQLVTFANGAGLVPNGSDPLLRSRSSPFAQGGIGGSLGTPAAWEPVTTSSSGSNYVPGDSDSGGPPGGPIVVTPEPTEPGGPGGTPGGPIVVTPEPTEPGGPGTQTPPGDTDPPIDPTNPPTKPDPEPPVIVPELPWPPELPGTPGTEPPPGREVPEPSTLWLSCAAFAAMLLLKRKKSRSKR